MLRSMVPLLSKTSYYLLIELAKVMLQSLTGNIDKASWLVIETERVPWVK